nr:hypothetical protein 5 [Desulfobacterales bacterium]
MIASVASFAFFLLLMGSVLNDEGEQPDLGIFTVPVFYAAVAAIVAWYLPIRKRSEKEDGGNVLGTLDGP